MKMKRFFVMLVCLLFVGTFAACREKENEYASIGITLNELIENSNGSYQLPYFTKRVGNFTYNYSTKSSADGRSRIIVDTDSEDSPIRSITFVWDFKSDSMITMAEVSDNSYILPLITLLSSNLDTVFPPNDETSLESFAASGNFVSEIIKNGMGIYHNCRVLFDYNDYEAYCTISPLEDKLTVDDMKSRSYFSEFLRLPTPNDYAEITEVNSDIEYIYYTYLASEDPDEAFEKFGDYAAYIEQKGFIVENMGTNDYPILNGNGSQIATLSIKKEGEKCLFVFAFKK